MSLRPLFAVAGLTVKEAVRLRLWIPVAVAGIVISAAGLSLGAVGPDARLKLSVVTVSSAIAFVVVLLSVLQGPSQMRRDLDARVAFLLFSKPVPRVQYLLGRWLGVVAGLGGAILMLSLLSCAVVWFGLGRLPEYRAITTPKSWSGVSALGETTPIAENADRQSLSGNAAGDAVRWTFTGVARRDEGYDLLLRVQMRGGEVQQCLAGVSAIPGGSGQAMVLSLAETSPYGRSTDGQPLAPGQVVLLHKDTSRTDFSQDYLHLRLPKEAIGEDGTTTIQLTRLQSDAALTTTKERTLLLAQAGGGFIENLLRGGLVLLASAGLLVAWTLLIASVSNLGVTLLAGLTLYFAGSILWILPDAMLYDNYSRPMQRMLQLVMNVFPDLDRFRTAADLAAGRAVTWGTVAWAWVYYGIYTTVFLSIGYLVLRRREM